MFICVDDTIQKYSFLGLSKITIKNYAAFDHLPRIFLRNCTHENALNSSFGRYVKGCRHLFASVDVVTFKVYEFLTFYH